MRLHSAEIITEFLRQLSASGPVLLVGIDGPGGSGKSTVAEQVAQAVGAAVVRVDDFYRPSDQRWYGSDADRPIGADFDLQRLRVQVLIPLTAGSPAAYQRYDWGRDALAETHTVEPRGIVIVEGIYALHKELRDYYHTSIWVECPRSLRWARGLARDGAEAAEQWEQWMRDEDRYMIEQRPQEAAQLVVSGCS